VHALSVALLGNTVYTWRVFDFAIMVLCTLAACSTIKSLWGARAAAWFLVLYPALYVVLGQWVAGERDVFGANLLFVSIWFYWNGLTRGKAVWQIGTGAFIALSALIKPTFAVFGFFLALHCFFAVRASMCSLKQRFIHLDIAGISSFVGLGVGLALLKTQGTSLAMFRELAFESVVLRYGNDGAPPLKMLMTCFQYFIQHWHWITAGALIGLVMNLGRREPDSLAKNMLFPTLWAAGIAAFLLQAHGLGYTLGVPYAAMIPMLCSGLGLITFRERAYRNWRSVLLVGAIGVVLAGTAKKWVGEFGSSLRFLTGQITAEVHYATGECAAGDGLRAAEAMALAEELKERVPEDGTILVWGRANVINFLAKRPQPTRFHHNVVIMRRYLPEHLATKWNAWFREEVETRAPEACVINERELEGEPPMPECVTFLREYLQTHYDRVGRVADSESALYYRKPGESRSAD
jgi:hypothetical protein